MDPIPDPAFRVQSLFADFLARKEAGETPDFGALCRDHPRDADALRKMRAEWDRTRVVTRLVGDKSGSHRARLEQKHGEGVEPTVQLDEGPTGPPGSATEELVRRLSQHAPITSRYKLEGEVARGGMGAILKVWDEDLRRHLAMKVVLGKGEPTRTGLTPPVDAQQLARFLEEAQVTGQLDHPGIVPVHELGLDSDGRVFFTMKLVKGRDLKKIFDLVFEEQEGWNETRALGVILKVCEAMAYAHKKGVIHRDLKPANVMVGNFGEVYVMDWGLARVLGRKDLHDIRLQPLFATAFTQVKSERRETREEAPDSPLVTMDGDVMGTPAYMPPEQARGEVEKLTARADVYAIGSMLYHLLTRQIPYVVPMARVSNRTILARVIDGPPPPLSTLRKDVPAELVAICEKAMEREPAQRYPDTLALAEDLRAYLENRVVNAYETGTWAETKKWVERNKPLAASLAAAIVLLVAGLSASLVFKARADEKAAELLTANTTIQQKEQLALQRATDLGVANTTIKAKNAELTAAKTAAEQKSNDVLSLSAIQELKELSDRADALWPASPDKVAQYDNWLADAKVLIDGRTPDPARGITAHPSLKDHEAKLAEIRRRAKHPTPEHLGNDHGSFEFDDAQDRWWYTQLAQLVTDLNAFTDEKSGGLYSSGTSGQHGWGIVKRAEFARTIEERSVTGAEAKRRWDEAIAAIAKSPRYGGLGLTPQLGLFPISEDPDSHLWEFAHVQTGEPAQRGADGRLILKEDMGLVFVLIPACTFWMGAQKTDPNGHNYDPQALANESPVHAVNLDAFFLSKYEMTQGQWERFVGRNPSYFGPRIYSSGWNRAGRAWNALHPVEQVSWNDCAEVLRRLDLLLPTEAQWEHGCRGSTSTVYWCGDDGATLADVGNVADQYAKQHGGGGWSVGHEAWDDGNTVTAEVGSYRANDLGLHDTHGNVWEWCREWYGTTQNFAAGDGERQVSGSALRVPRGGSFSLASSYARSAFRYVGPPDARDNFLGLRPSRALTP